MDVVLVDLAQNTLDGVATGASYALIALGFTLVFGVMRRLNLAYGPTILAGAYLGALLHAKLGLGALAVAAAGRLARWSNPRSVAAVPIIAAGDDSI